MDKKDLNEYTYEQLVTLCLQLQGFLNCSNENLIKLQSENEFLRNQLSLIDGILHPNRS